MTTQLRSSLTKGLAVAAVAIAGGGSSVHGQCPGRWSTEIGTPGVNGTVLALAVLPEDLGGDVIVGGRFTMAGGAPAANIARYSVRTNTWSPMEGGVTGGVPPAVVTAVAVIRSPHGAAVVVGGKFTTVGPGVAATKLARFDLDTSTWSAMRLAGVQSIDSMAVRRDGQLLVGGLFSSPNSPWVGQVVRLDPAHESWSPIPGVSSRSVLAVAVLPHDDVLAGGAFSGMGTSGPSRFVRFNASTGSWSRFGVGPSNWVYAVGATANGDLYAGGIFSTVGGMAAQGIARFEAASGTWMQLGGGIDGSALAILPSPRNTVIVGGAFCTADGVALNCVGEYDPATNAWSRLGTISPGVSSCASSSVVAALALLPDKDLLVGGSFATAGGQNARSIARFALGGAPIRCLADCDCSGAIDINDVYHAIRVVLTRDRFGDLNGDGVIGVKDLFDFLDAYLRGAC